MKEKLEKILGKEEYESLQIYLVNTGLNVEELYKMESDERIRTIKSYCQKNDRDFTSVYSAVESTKDKMFKEKAIKSAATAILARDGSALVNDPELSRKIREKVERLENKQ